MRYGDNMDGHSSEDLVRLHEKWMTFMENRVGEVERNVNKIPWILLGVLVSSVFSTVNLVVVLVQLLKHA